MSLDLSIVIFTRNDAEHLGRCLASLAARPPRATFETIVVDNASEDDSAAVLAGAPLAARHLALSEETSFSHGNNLGLAQARGEHVLFLNPDTLPTGAVIDRCLAVVRGGGWGLVSPRLTWPDGTHQPTGWHLPTPRQLAREHFGRTGREVPPGEDPVTEVGWLMGCFLLGPRAAVESVGGWDEAFWFHGTDLELCARYDATSLGIGRVEDVSMVHVGHRGWDAERRRKSQEALVQWLRRDHGAASAEVVAAATRLVEAIRS